MRISYDEYSKIAKTLVLRIKELEKAGEEGGVEQRKLVEWYVEQHLEQIESESDAVMLTKKLSCIIQRLIMQDGLFVRV